MKTIVAIARQSVWQKAKETGQYTQSTIKTTLEEVGFIHCSFPNQTIGIANRHFTDEDNLVLLLIDEDKVTSPVKHEGALSGRAGTFPHIYGPLNTDAVYAVAPLAKDVAGLFTEPEALQRAQKATA